MLKMFGEKLATIKTSSAQPPSLSFCSPGQQRPTKKVAKSSQMQPHHWRSRLLVVHYCESLFQPAKRLDGHHGDELVCVDQRLHFEYLPSYTYSLDRDDLQAVTYDFILIGAVIDQLGFYRNSM